MASCFALKSFSFSFVLQVIDPYSLNFPGMGFTMSYSQTVKGKLYRVMFFHHSSYQKFWLGLISTHLHHMSLLPVFTPPLLFFCLDAICFTVFVSLFHWSLLDYLLLWCLEFFKVHLCFIPACQQVCICDLHYTDRNEKGKSKPFSLS